MTPEMDRAMRMLREDRRRDLYESAAFDNRRVGSGHYYLTYSSGQGPRLVRTEIDELLRAGLIKPKWPDKPELNCYVASEEVR